MTIYKMYTLEHPQTGEIRYVGTTTGELNERLSGHIYDGKNKSSHKAKWIKSLLNQGLRPVIKYLDECEESIWEIIEKYYISQFKCWGFNLTNDDEGGKGSIINRSDKHIDGFQRSIEAHKKTVHCYTKDGEYLLTFDSIKEGAEFIGKNDNTVTECLRGRSKSAGGYQWSYIKVDKLEPIKLDCGKSGLITLTNIEGSTTHASIKAVERFLKVGRPKVIKALKSGLELNGYTVTVKI